MKVDLRKTLFILPNLFTLSSVLCGFYAILLGASSPTEESFYRASLMIIFAMFFDTIDGRVARLTKTQSAIGVQLDSLADIVSFGVAPAVLVYHWSLSQLHTWGLLASFTFVGAGAIRLARFNVLAMGDDGSPKKPSKYILGLPIPGAAGILVSLVVANHELEGSLPLLKILVLGLVLLLAFLMVSTIRFRSFKELQLSKWTLAAVGFILMTSVVLTLRFHISVALAWLLCGYVVLALSESVVFLIRNRS